ncbi:tRNA U44 2'-O-methyltransferase [Candida orthopsilosis Co 90-125]|uniref:tRNA (uracil-O(2)-)-methyltransferase n=1 Tax=Candida orthopsilosis (strain 90-125) TaxID=1136231 RepID=H8X008_CANO9|nr:tRNA U44 2'-O-methyltransferase [Candida orthopsilosis Co 90-125]CCG22353.1 tRNA U44 2'-O-methyltransferase [Candida orthopsilosis Co 90-125]
MRFVQKKRSTKLIQLMSPSIAMPPKSTKGKEPTLLINGESVLGERWCPIYEKDTNFESSHFEQAMLNIIKQPNINSTVILRADILKERVFDPNEGETTFISKLINTVPDVESKDQGSDVVLLHRDLQDVNIREINLDGCQLYLKNRCEIVRRMIPRNPFKDYIINQTCLVMKTEDEQNVLVVYVPHIHTAEEIPYYLPPVYAVGILYHNHKVSLHYLPFELDNWREEKNKLKNMNLSERPIRIALRLLQTSTKHSSGVKLGYEKRVNHDLVVSKVDFQNRYITLKSKYSSDLVNSWCESTDPKKHVFEDLAIAAFLIEYWKLKKFNKDEFEFRDLGCGNGLLVYILMMEGYRGEGIDARARKSWKMYPPEVQEKLVEKIIVPSILLKPHPSLAKIAPHIKDNGRQFAEPKNNQVNYHTAESLLNSPNVCTTEDFSKNTFLIGNHSDELTCWIPLLEFPFMVIPCCSHALNGNKMRFPPRKVKTALPNQASTSTYGSLVDHVEDIAILNGWQIEKEMLRIPSTRNAAVMSCEKVKPFQGEPQEISQLRVLDIIAMEGGAEGWVENSLNLMKKAPRSH